MSKLEKILKKINPKKALFTGLLFTSLIFGCDKDSPTQSPAPQPKSNKTPTTRIIAPTNNSTYNTNSVNAQWSGSDEDGRVVGYSVVLDNGAFSDFATNYTSKNFSNLSNGIHNFKVAARDDKGADDPNPPQVSFTVSAETIGPIDNTNTSGYTKIELGTNVFHVYVKNLSNQPLSNIKVSGVDYGLIQGFLAEDFSNNYLSEIYYVGGYGLGKFATVAVDTPKIFLRAKVNNETRLRKLPDLKNNQKLEYLGTASFSDIKIFYQEYDLIFNITSLLEYIVDAGFKKFEFPLRAAKFREDIIDNASNYGKIVNQIASLIGQEWDPDALYFDIYRHKLISVVNHYFDENKLCTLKGKVTDSNNQPISNARVSISFFYDDTNQNGEYVIKSYKDVKKNIEALLKEGSYDVTASATNYFIETKTISLIAPKSRDPNNPYYASNKLDFQLQPKSSGSQTIVIQPGPANGKDAHVYIVKVGSSSTFANDNFGNESLMSVISEKDQNNVEYYSRSFLQFDLSQIPSNSTINSATLEAYLDPESNYTVSSSLNLKCKEISNNWSESTVTWNNQPALGNTLDSKLVNYNGQPNNSGDASWKSFTITSLVQQWVSNQKINYGISITTDDPPIIYYCEPFIYSSDHTDSAKRPKLTITYTN